MNYDVPRKPGFYWVSDGDGGRTAIAENFVKRGSGTNIYGEHWEALWQWWNYPGDDSGDRRPAYVLAGPLEPPES